MTTPNPYLFEIENFKKKTTLAHEAGAGASCNKCQDKCSGFDLHFWRKICKNCHCTKEDHNVAAEPEDSGFRRIGRLFDHPERSIKEEITYTYDIPVSQDASNNNSFSDAFDKKCSITNQQTTEFPSIDKSNANTDQSTPVQKVKVTFEWVPPDTPEHVAKKYMQQLPKDEQPIKGSVGAAQRQKRIAWQLPAHDMELSAHQDLTNQEVEQFNAIDDQKKNAVGMGDLKEQPQLSKWSCEKCKQMMFPGDVAIFADRAGADKCWHPGCFVCTTCQQLLVDLIYFYKDGDIFCGRHFSEKLAPRCSACDELILAKNYTVANGQNWHVNHFCCWECDQPLGGQRYVPRDEKPYCFNCYDRLFSKICHTCQVKISAEQQCVKHSHLDWHATPECFRCSGCLGNLLNRKFMVKQDMIFCSAECRNKIFS